MSEAADPCAECGGSCCSFRKMRISYHSLEAGERYDSFLLDHDISNLILEDGTPMQARWHVGKNADGDRFLFFECEHLEDGRCGVYEDRPSMCKMFECPVLKGDEDLEPFLDDVQRVDGEFETFQELYEVTERVNEILEREAADD